MWGGLIEVTSENDDEIETEKTKTMYIIMEVRWFASKLNDSVKR